MGIVQFQAYCQFAFLPMRFLFSCIFWHCYMAHNFTHASACIYSYDILCTQVLLYAQNISWIWWSGRVSHSQTAMSAETAGNTPQLGGPDKYILSRTREILFTKHSHICTPRASLFHYTLAGLFMTFYPQDVSSSYLNTWVSSNCDTLASTHVDTLIHTWIQPSDIFWQCGVETIHTQHKNNPQLRTTQNDKHTYVRNWSSVLVMYACVRTCARTMRTYIIVLRVWVCVCVGVCVCGVHVCVYVYVCKGSMLKTQPDLKGNLIRLLMNPTRYFYFARCECVYIYFYFIHSLYVPRLFVLSYFEGWE